MVHFFSQKEKKSDYIEHNLFYLLYCMKYKHCRDEMEKSVKKIRLENWCESCCQVSTLEGIMTM